MAKKCKQAGVKYPEVKDIQGKKKVTKKRDVQAKDFNSKDRGRNLKPFHWDLAFNEIMNKGGFDAIITNPPWEKVKLEDKEFFHKYDKSIDKKKTKNDVLQRKKKELLKKAEIEENYKKTKEFYIFHQSYFSTLYQYQSSKIINMDGTEKEASADMDIYRPFLERCFKLLDENGTLGIVLKSGLCKDEGSIGLRKELLFKKTKIEGIIDFQNQMAKGKGKGKIFEGVHASEKFLLLSLKKTEPKEQDGFPTKFQTRDLTVLEHFPEHRSGESDNKRIDTNTIHHESETVWQSIQEIKKLSPRDCSIIEFKSSKDKEILKKASQFPKIGERLDNSWNPDFYTEFHETNDSHLFKDNKASEDDLPLYKGSAIYQYDYKLSNVNRYVSLKDPKIQGKSRCFKNKCYANYRLVIRTIAGKTNERSLISAVIPKNYFISNSLHGVFIELPDKVPLAKKGFSSDLKTQKQVLFQGTDKSGKGDALNKNNNQKKSSQYMLLLQTFLNSFVVDYFIRLKISSNINKHYITPLHIPRLTEKDLYFNELVERSAKLTCIGEEFDELADEIGIARGGVKDTQERWKIQGEIDAIVARVYGLTPEEFDYILNTFTTGKNQKRLHALKKYAFSAFKKNKLFKKVS